jgi:large subunit ribosomal protein L19
MSSQIIREIESGLMRQETPEFRPGDTIRVSVKIVEGDKERLQDFEGVCIRRKGTGIAETFTLRRVSYGVGMERIFALHSPKLEKIKVVRHGRVRRSKLYYLRALRGKKARIAERKGIETKTLGIGVAQSPAPAAQETAGSEQPSGATTAAAAAEPTSAEATTEKAPE